MTSAAPEPTPHRDTHSVSAYAHVYRVTKYDPRDRDSTGSYVGPLDSENDEGPVEATYVAAARAFLLESRVDRLTVRDPEAHLPAGDPDRIPLPPDHPLARLFGTELEGWYDGADVSVDDACEVVRWMLRSAVWCRLEYGDAAAVHVGYDMYLYVCTDRPCPGTLDSTARLGLFAEELERSPHERDDDVDPAPPADDAFWASVDALARAHGELCIVEEAAWPRHFTMSAGGTRPTLRPGARVSVWPQWTPPGRRRVLATRRRRSARPGDADGTVLAEGLVWGGAPLPPDLYEEAPVLRAILPDPTGTVSARWPAWIVEGD